MNSDFSAKDVVQAILKDCHRKPVQVMAQAFAPANIALCKYWGKRNAALNLPVTSSLSISLGNYGTSTRISEWDGAEDSIQVNQVIDPHLSGDEGRNHIEGDMGNRNNGSNISKQNFHRGSFNDRLIQFLDLIRPNSQTHYRIETESNIPIAAGFASSASGFAALVLACNQLYGWALPAEHLSIIARLGSGSACRSLWHGFVEWECGEDRDGMDSHGKPLDKQWTDLRLGLLIINDHEKPLSSRLAMKRTQETSIFYNLWPKKVSQDLERLKTAILQEDFKLLGETAESNAEAMHALMMTASPSIVYTLPDTLKGMQRVWTCRREGLPVYFTQDAGPNLKLLFLEKDREAVCQAFPDLWVVDPGFADIEARPGEPSAKPPLFRDYVKATRGERGMDGHSAYD